jgi:ABC-2 type transport system permease protein
MTAAVALPADTGLRFPRLVRSEWIKLRSLRSTVWCYAILFVLTVALSALPALVINSGGHAVSGKTADQVLVQLGTSSVTLTSLVVAVLGVLIISGEYGTGMIRATFTVEPGRFGVLAAKALVLALSTFVVSIVSTWIGVLLAQPLLAANKVHGDLAHPAVYLPILGASVYVMLIALLAFGVGLLIRATAGGITITLCALLVLPTVVAIIAQLTHAQWIANVGAFLPSAAGSQLFTYASSSQADPGAVVLNGWGGFAVLLAEVVVVGALAFTAARRRDV